MAPSTSQATSGWSTHYVALRRRWAVPARHDRRIADARRRRERGAGRAHAWPVAGRVPVFVGVGGNATAKVVKTLKRLERLPFEGIVSVCPYYNRPSQDGLIAHFRAIASETDREVLIYNIPYRTAVNLSNDSLLELAEVPNIVGVKDSSRHPRPVARAAGAQARGLLGADRRGRALFHHDGQRRRRRHPGGEPPHDRALPRGRPPLRRQRRRRRARRLGAARVLRAAAVRRGQSDADQVPAVAAGPDRLARMPPAADAGSPTRWPAGSTPRPPSGWRPSSRAPSADRGSRSAAPAPWSAARAAAGRPVPARTGGSCP